MFTRDLATFLLFLSGYLHTHSLALRPSTSHTQDMRDAVNSLFVSLADIFHCWSSSQIFKREFKAATFTLAENSRQFHYCRQFCSSVGQTPPTSQSKKLPNLLLVCLELLVPLNDQMFSPDDRIMVDMVKEKLGKVCTHTSPNTYPHTHTHTKHMPTHTHTKHMPTHTHTYMYPLTHTHTYIYTPDTHPLSHMHIHTHTQKKVIAEDMKEDIIQELEGVSHPLTPSHITLTPSHITLTPSHITLTSHCCPHRELARVSP